MTNNKEEILKVKSNEFWEGFDYALNLLEEMYGKYNFRHGYNISDCVKAKVNRLPKNKIRQMPFNNS